jgi:arylformamidase
MKYYDITVPISPHMPVYEGDPPVEVTSFSSIAKGNPANILRLQISTHTGTHIDAPLHFFEGGKNICAIPPELLIGPALVIDAGDADEITPEFITSAHIQGIKRILFKTRNSTYWNEQRFRKDFAYVSAGASRRLVELGVQLVGIDYLSVEKFGSPDHATHLTLLRAEIIVLEGLNLSEVSEGIYELICLPLPVHNGDGAPCRAILLEK